MLYIPEGVSEGVIALAGAPLEESPGEPTGGDPELGGPLAAALPWLISFP